MSKEVFQIAEERKELKGKGERKRYTPLNAELQRIARGDKKAFLNEQCKEIEENNRMGKNRNPTIKLEILREYVMRGWSMTKDRNSKDLT